MGIQRYEENFVKIKTTKGLRQARYLSPTLFKINLDRSLANLEEKRRHPRNKGGKKISFLQYSTLQEHAKIWITVPRK